MREITRHFERSAKGAKMSKNEPKLEKVNKSQLPGNEKVNKSQPRENIPNIETNLPQVVKMRREAPKSNFSGLKALKSEGFRRNNLRGRPRGAYKMQI